MADERKYYVLCSNNCKFESMTKEQILTAIEQAANDGTISDVDTGFITKIKEQNKQTALTFWVGTSAEYNAISEKADDCFYILTDDTTGEDIKTAIKEIRAEVEALAKKTPPCAQIIVTTQGGTVKCTDANGNRIMHFSSAGNVWKFDVSSYGTYTITGIYGTKEVTATVEVNAVKQFDVSLVFYDTDFAANSWEDIATICKSGIVPSEWAVGDAKTLKTADGATEYEICIIGKNHDEYENGNVAPYTFAFRRTGNYPLPLAGKYMNWDEQTNVGGWTASDMYTTHIPEFVSKLPSSITNAVTAVKKLTSAGSMSSDILVSYDTFFLLSEVEYFGNNNNSIAGEGRQYEYLKNGNTLTGKTANDKYCWLRSPTANKTTRWVLVKEYAYGDGVAASFLSDYQTRTYGMLAFCF